ncbi:hypothetical protein L1987_71464 [Smallanthus sonchifolius]|uniref:Uncharacterized protein n=1 Tax=Smallanthus sonchifolius TaxID=185202 RepID=A0ACB9ASH9_9ASTR|nr:hypothetical protein L1987_71464 [Smallanthus sonchifolius]
MLFAMPYDQHICPYASSSSVDCTLSLATPSARLTSDDYNSRFCWDFLQPDNPSRPPPSLKSIRGAGDSLLARRCANCDTTSTPLWRNGPRGPKKEERRANAATTTVAGGGLDGLEGYNGNTWMHNAQAATHKLPSCYSPGTVGGEFRFIDYVDDRDSTFMSWRLNVTDKAGLVRDFTRY